MDETADASVSRRGAEPRGPATPGLVVVFTQNAPAFAIHAVTGPIVVGRGEDCDVAIDDRRASRRHAQLAWRDGAWHVEDLGSHNGTYVDGVRVTAPVVVHGDAVLAVGNTVFLLACDTRPLGGGVTTRADGVVLGPALRAVWDTVERIAATGDVLHVVGETGTGKELVARHFHATRCPSGPFVAVNCAAVPPLLAERLFFGARKGTYSGADADMDGYLVAAEGGVLFLDELGELPLEVQPKLLRALELNEVTPLGAARPRKLELAICSATHVDLAAAIGAGRFREDLYFRIATPAVTVPRLSERREEIPWLIAQALARTSLRAHASFVETALVRPWPGNSRELLGAVGSARSLVEPGEDMLKMAHMPERAGRNLPGAAPVAPVEVADELPSREDARIRAALRAANGNVTHTARALGLHRNQLRRWLKRNDVDPTTFRSLLRDDSE